MQPFLTEVIMVALQNILINLLIQRDEHVILRLQMFKYFPGQGL